MIKNFGKLKQWTNEKLGSGKITLQNEEVERLQVEIESKKLGYEKVCKAAQLLQTQLAKKKPSPEDNKTNRLPNDILGVCLSKYGNEFTDDSNSSLGVASTNFGSAQSRLAQCQEDYADALKNGYLEKLEAGTTLLKEYSQLRKKLESRRLEYDTNQNNIQKSKKEDPKLEQQLQESKQKYEDTEDDVIQKIARLQDFEEEHTEALYSFLEVQIDYFTKSLEVLTEAKDKWGQKNAISSIVVSSKFGGGTTRTLSRTSDNSDDNNTNSNSTPLPLRNNSSSTARRIPPPPAPTIASRKSSVSNGGGGGMVSESENGATLPYGRMPPSLPNRPSTAEKLANNEPQRKALYEFRGNDADDLSFNIGDVIIVIEETDKGWWTGELDGRRGLFPVDYTEEIPPVPVVPYIAIRPTMLSSAISAPVIAFKEEQDSSPFDDANRTSMNSIHAKNNIAAVVNNNNNSPMNSPVPVRQRAPPPPPPTRGSSQPRLLPTGGIMTAPSTPKNLQKIASDYNCGECDCTEYSANIFKKGHCNNCFHKHTN